MCSKEKKYQIWHLEDLHYEEDHTLIFEGILSEMLRAFPANEYLANHFFMVQSDVWKSSNKDYSSTYDQNLIEVGRHCDWWKECNDPR